jgi:hypothetical protein
MAWVRIDDQFTDHPKLAAAGPVAGWVYVSGLCYAARYLTDGFVPETIALRFDGSSPEVLANLVECSLWDRVNGGYLIHDFLDYNPPASKVKAEREAAKARMKGNRQGNPQRSAEVRPNISRTSPEVQPSPSPSDDDREWQQALADMQVLGLWSKADKDRFADMWSELTGRHDWVGKAITIARDKGARAGIPYALKVLANAIHTGKEPGYVNGTGSETPKARPSYDNPEALERSRRIEEAARELAKQGVTQETDHLWMVKLDDLVEAKYGSRP